MGHRFLAEAPGRLSSRRLDALESASAGRIAGTRACRAETTRQTSAEDQSLYGCLFGRTGSELGTGQAAEIGLGRFPQSGAIVE